MHNNAHKTANGGLHDSDTSDYLQNGSSSIKTITVQPYTIDGKPDTPTSTTEPSTSYRSLWLAYFLLGTLNNFTYVVILSAAKSLATDFNDLQYIGIIPWANVSAGIVIRIINTVYWLDTSPNTRVLGNTVVYGLALIALALSPYIGFGFAILSITVLGCCSSLGESVVLGYMKTSDSKLVGSWASGTGFAGVAGTSIYLFLYSVLRLSNQQTFLLLFPTAIVYGLTWLYIYRSTAGSYQSTMSSSSSLVHPSDDGSLHRAPKHHRKSSELPLNANAASTPSKHSSSYISLLNESDDSERHTTDNDCDGNIDVLPAPLQSAWSVWLFVSSRAMQLAAVYFFEYVVSVGFAARSNPLTGDASIDSNWWYINSYEILAFCYQIGVFIARSSISLLQIHRIYLLTLLQALNFVLWGVHVYYHILPLPLQFVLMVYVGLLGGAMYVNVFHLLLEEKQLVPSDLELGIQYTTISINVGIVLSSVFELVVDNAYPVKR